MVWLVGSVKRVFLEKAGMSALNDAARLKKPEGKPRQLRIWDIKYTEAGIKR